MDPSQICADCGGACCRRMWFYSNDPADALRYDWLATDIVVVERVAESTWKIIIEAPCRHFLNNGCAVHDEPRPRYCSGYPWNYLTGDVERGVIEHEATTCPLLHRLLQGPVREAMTPAGAPTLVLEHRTA